MKVKYSILIIWAFLVASCSDFIVDKKYPLVITFNVSDFVQTTTRNATINSDNTDYYLVVSVKGDYEETKSVSFSTLETCNLTFDSVPVGAKIYVEANAYHVDRYESVVDSCHCFTGKSSKKRISSGKNTVNLVFEKLNPADGYYSDTLFTGNYFDDESNISYDYYFYNTGKYRIIIGQGTLVSEGTWSGNFEIGKSLVMEENVFKNEDGSLTILDIPVTNIILVDNPTNDYAVCSLLFKSQNGTSFSIDVFN